MDSEATRNIPGRKKIFPQYKNFLFQGMGQKPNWLHKSRNNDRDLPDLQGKV